MHLLKIFLVQVQPADSECSDHTVWGNPHHRQCNQPNNNFSVVLKEGETEFAFVFVYICKVTNPTIIAALFSKKMYVWTISSILKLLQKLHSVRFAYIKSKKMSIWTIKSIL